MGLKESLEKYEKASKWINEAPPDEVEKHYTRYLQLVETVRECFDEWIKELGYNPYENIEELMEELK